MCFIMGAKLKFLMKEVITMTTTEKLAIAKALMEEFSEAKKPSKSADAMTWCEEGIDKILSAYNDLKGTDAASKDVGEVYARIDALKAAYNEASCSNHMEKIKSQQQGSMMYAINNPHYRTIKIKKGTKNNGFQESKDTADRRIDLLKLQEFCGGTAGGFGADIKWIMTMTDTWIDFQARGVIDGISEEITAAEISATKTGSKMSDDDAKKQIMASRISKVLTPHFGKEYADKVAADGGISNGTLEKMLRKTVSQMLGDGEENKKYLPKMVDARYIVKVYAKRSRREENTVEYPKFKEFADIIMDILRNKVCGIEYKDITRTK